ncbi:hypothetical protein C3L33_11657, partial [Rhododendron williamsianum]
MCRGESVNFLNWLLSVLHSAYLALRTVLAYCITCGLDFLSMLNAARALIVLITLTIKQAFFPQITSPHGCPVKIQDTEGKEWGFHFCYWLNNGSKMYVLEGLKDYIGSMQWQAGDIVTFYRIEPEKKLVMGLRKTCAGVPPYEVKGNVH